MSDKKKITNFIKFHESSFIEPLKTIRDGFGDRGVDTNIYICGLLVCCGIDTLCGYVNGEKTIGRKFIEFIEKEIYQDRRDELASCLHVEDLENVVSNDVYGGIENRRCISISELLYSQFRCGLVHTFSFNGCGAFYINHESPSEKKFQFDHERGLVIDFPYFYDGYINYWGEYKNRLLRGDNSVKPKFIRRYNNLRPRLSQR